jgi:tRNA-Thr(GGU) m(6)t(6)A37 methyltransferase TsaA
MTPIGTIRSCFQERFGIPRQPRLAPDARAVLAVDPPFRAALRGLEGFSHVWIIFVFHKSGRALSVRPPRLGGRRSVGTFATRSPHRPNPIGISAVRLESVDPRAGTLALSGVDLLDGTPVLDVKPYLPYADSIPRAALGWAAEKQRRLRVRFSARARSNCRRSGHPRLASLIRQMLRLDPRPAFQRRTSADYAARVLDVDVRWTVAGNRCTVTDVQCQDLNDSSST